MKPTLARFRGRSVFAAREITVTFRKHVNGADDGVQVPPGLARSDGLMRGLWSPCKTEITIERSKCSVMISDAGVFCVSYCHLSNSPQATDCCRLQTVIVRRGYVSRTTITASQLVCGHIGRDRSNHKHILSIHG